MLKFENFKDKVYEELEAAEVLTSKAPSSTDPPSILTTNKMTAGNWEAITKKYQNKFKISGDTVTDKSGGSIEINENVNFEIKSDSAALYKFTYSTMLDGIPIYRLAITGGPKKLTFVSDKDWVRLSKIMKIYKKAYESIKQPVAPAVPAPAPAAPVQPVAPPNTTVSTGENPTTNKPAPVLNYQYKESLLDFTNFIKINEATTQEFISASVSNILTTYKDYIVNAVMNMGSVLKDNGLNAILAENIDENQKKEKLFNYVKKILESLESYQIIKDFQYKNLSSIKPQWLVKIKAYRGNDFATLKIDPTNKSTLKLGDSIKIYYGKNTKDGITFSENNPTQIKIFSIKKTNTI